jgi:hypothetical protein
MNDKIIKKWCAAKIPIVGKRYCLDIEGAKACNIRLKNKDIWINTEYYGKQK